LIGGLFVGSELRALNEFEWEINNVKGNAYPVKWGPSDPSDIVLATDP